MQITGKMNPSYFCKEGEGKIDVNENTDDFPVESVSWSDANECIAKMEVPPELMGWKIALPSEAQWEYACRGGQQGSVFYWGNDLQGDRANCNWSQPVGEWDGKGEYRKRTTRVGSYEEKAKHPWGLVDMLGNVLEWCEDYYGSYDKLPKLRNPVQLQKQPTDDVRIMRGGAWNYLPDYCRVEYRFNLDADFRFNNVGFRVVLVP